MPETIPENVPRQDGSIELTNAEVTVETVGAEPSPHALDVTQTFEADLNVVLGIFLIALILTGVARRLGQAAAATTFRRWLPVTYGTIWGVAVISITFVYAKGLSTTWLLLIWLAFIFLFFISVGGLRSVMSGIAMTLEQRLQIGDSIRISDVEGQIIGFGMRSVRVRSVDGTIHEIPNDKFVTEAVANLSGDGGDSACEITVRVPDEIKPEHAVELARRIAILTPLASPRHQPEVFLNTVGELEQKFVVHIRGYAFDQGHQDHYRSDVVARLQEEFHRAADNTFQTAQSASGILLEE